MANELVTKSYDIDISKTGARPIVKMSQYDTRTVRVLFTVYDGTELQAIDGCTARVDGKRSDGTAFTAPCDIEQGSKVGFTVESEMTNAYGMHEAELVIINSDGNPLGTQNFTIAVEKAPFERENAATADDRTLYDQYTTAVDARVTAAIKKADDAVAADTGKVDKLVSDTQARIDAIVSEVVTPSDFQSLSEKVTANTTDIGSNTSSIARLTADTRWVNVNDSVWYRKVGHVVSVRLVWTGGGGVSAGNLPSGARPSIELLFIALNAKDGYHAWPVYIKTNGDVFIGEGNLRNGVSGIFTYVVGL